jgi:multiple sugar transport system permease protein
MADSTSLSLPATQAIPARRSGGGLKGVLRRRAIVGALMTAPLIALLGGLVAYPAVYAIYLSLLSRNMTHFVGFHNFILLLRRDTFHMVVFQSALFAVTAVIFKAVIGFTLAHLMHNVPSRRQRVFRGLLLLPWVIPLALSTLGWWWLFEPTSSALNWLLVRIGLPPQDWLGDPWTARFCMILVNTWWGEPFFMIMYLAALKSVPEQLFEAAAIDGASAWQKLRYVTLPMMRNIISLTMLFSLIVTFANFDIVRILTNGGPVNTTHIFATYAFQVGIQSGDIPLGAAVSLFMLPVLAISSFFVLRGISRRSQEAM